MQFEAIKATLHSRIPDLDDRYAAFVKDHSADDLAVFVERLRAEGLIDAETAASLAVADGTLATPNPTAAPTLANPVPAPPAPPPGVRTANPSISNAPDPADKAAAEARKERLERLRQRAPSLPPQTQIATQNQPTVGAPPDVPGRGYKFVGKIGEGAMGEVLIAKDLDLHRTVAYKVMSESIAEQPQLASKFYGEAQITAQLDHPNIVPVYTLARAPNGTLAYTMKFIRGRTFEKLIEETRDQYKAGKLDDRHTVSARLEQFLKVCDAMHYAHSRAVVHRDLKPENIMVGAYGEVYVMDWGIARLFHIEGAKREDLVLVEGYQESEKLGDGGEEDDDDEGGMIIGTPQYMSPEQAHGRPDINGLSDQYSLGLILWELVTLKQAVTGKSPLKIVMRQQDGDKDPMVHMFGEAIAPEIKAIIEKATAKKPEHRYKDVNHLADDIRRFLRGEAVLARPDTLRQKVMRWVGRHRELTLAAIFLLILGSGGILTATAGWTFYSQAQARHREQSMSQLLTASSAQAAMIDSYFARYQGLLGIVAASATEMLVRGELNAEKVYLSGEFGNPATAPSDLTPSKRYGVPISLEAPVFAIAPNMGSTQMADDFKRLTPLKRYLKRVLLLSKDEDATNFTPKRAARLITETGTPLAWTQIGLESGGYLAYPGQKMPDTFDPRNRPWYKLGKDSHQPTWGAPYVDPGALGLLLPCATPLYDDGDKPTFLGVAAVDLTFDFIISELLVTETLPKAAETFLVDDQGRIIVRSSERGKKFEGSSLGNRTIRMPEFPVPEVVSAIKDLQSGRISYRDGGVQELIVYTRMNTLGWYYVVQGPESALLGG